MAMPKPPLSARLAQLLSDQDIASITQSVDREALEGEVDADWLSRFARAVEGAVLAQLAKQAPVATAWIQNGTVVEVFAAAPNEESEEWTNKDAAWTRKGFRQKPLYANPQPVRQEQALRVALEEMEYANQLALESLGIEIIKPATIASLRAALE